MSESGRLEFGRFIVGAINNLGLIPGIGSADTVA